MTRRPQLPAKELAEFDQTLVQRRQQLLGLVKIYDELRGDGERYEVIVVGMSAWITDQISADDTADLLATAVHYIATTRKELP